MKQCIANNEGNVLEKAKCHTSQQGEVNDCLKTCCRKERTSTTVQVTEQVICPCIDLLPESAKNPNCCASVPSKGWILFVGDAIGDNGAVIYDPFEDGTLYCAVKGPNAPGGILLGTQSEVEACKSLFQDLASNSGIACNGQTCSIE